MLIGTVGETLGCVCLNWNIEDEVSHSQRRRSSISRKEGLSVREGLWMESWKIYKAALTC